MNKAPLLLFAGGFLLLTGACRKPTFIGDDLIPGEDYLSSQRIDTFTIKTYTLPDDSAVTSVNLFYSLGSMADQNDGEGHSFGKTTASMYSQILLPTNDLNFGTNPHADSLVLTLDYAALYGDSTARHSLTVYKMLDQIQSQLLYHSDARFHINPVPVGKKVNFVPDIRDSVFLYGFKTVPQLRIRMSDAFADQIITADTTELQNDTTFMDFLNGLYIEEDTFTAGYSNSIMLFDMTSSWSALTLYYHNDEGDSLFVALPFGTCVNRFTHQYPPGSSPAAYLSNPDTSGDDITFVQGFAGLRTFVEIPYLQNLEDISINKAQLTFTLPENTIDSTFPPPAKMLIVQSDSLMHNYYYLALYSQDFYYSIVDQQLGFTDIGGTLESQTDRFGQQVYVYQYDLTRHFQQIIDGKIPNRGFFLICYPGNRIPNAVTLCGSNYMDETRRPYLTITYTTVNK